MFGIKKHPLVHTDSTLAEELLTRGVAEVIDKEGLHKDLVSGRRLRVKLGIDPTSPVLHLGRAVLLLKLRKFQELGHTVVFIVGDMTGVIGDTSDKDSERPMLSRKRVEENAKKYFEQAGKVLDMGAVEKHFNSEWLSKLTYREIGEHADLFSVSDFIARENIKRRLDGGSRVSLREVLYPLMQGYDSVAVRADVEIGGTDQRFNLLAGRKLQEHFKQKPQHILTMDLISGTDGRKMSSSWGNTIGVSDDPTDMYGKVMSLPDDLVETYFVSATRVSLPEVTLLLEKQEPRDLKMRLAHEIVALYHGSKNASAAEESFVSVFQKKEVPQDVPETTASSGTRLSQLLGEVVSSKSEFRRLIKEGAVEEVGGEIITDSELIVTRDMTLRIGKRRFLKIHVQ